MSDPGFCPECGAQIPANSPAALCPKCMLRAGLSAESQDSAVKTTYSPGRVSGELVSTEELARRFPQLEILEFLGQGGMGAVYKARQRGLDRLVALKILRPEISQDPSFAERFTREARALARLNHPNIVSVYDFGQVEGLCFLLMEFVEGTNLRHTIRASRMSPREALAIVPQICDALQFAHDEGIIHRDIKPENILIDMKGRAKIADFGLAKLLGQDQPDFTLTGTNQIMGTPRYMAPEQIEATRDVDHRADIYSLGVVFYEMLTGELPLGRFAPPSEKVSIDVRLDDVVLRALEKEPERRYQHASDVKSEVEDIQSHAAPPPVAKPAVSTKASFGEIQARGRRQVRGPAIGIICAGMLNLSTPMLALMLTWFFMPISDPTNIGSTNQLHAAFPVAVGMLPVAASYSTGPRWLFLLLLPMLSSLLIGVITVLGGLAMLRCRSYTFAHVGAILALLPCSPGFLIGLPCGIWALVVLRNDDVKAAFERM